MKRIVLMGVLSSLIALFGCSKNIDQPEVPEWANNPRKVKTETALTKLGIPINRMLPLVEAEDEVRIRDPKAVATRAVVLYSVAAVGNGIDRNAIQKFLKTEGLWESVTPNERILFEKDDAPRQAIIDAAWRAEALWVLLWALGKVETLDLPTEHCDADYLHRMMPKKGEVAGFINASTLRPKSDLESVNLSV